MNNLTKIISERPFVVMGFAMVIGLLLGWVFFGGNGTVEKEGVLMEEHAHEAGTLWTCSMHPQIKLEKAGSCPICGMDLIPLKKENDDNGIDPDAVVLSASAMKIAEVETTLIEKSAPFKEVVLAGTVNPDERRINELTAHFPGRIEKLFVNFTGQKVSKGQLLATIFSPELVTAQKELFEAIKHEDSNPQFHAAARNKLKLWLFTDKQIDEIEKSGEVQYYFKILSPATGTVTKRNIAQGNHIMEGKSMFQIIDLRHLWVEFDAYESDIPWVKMGSEVEIKLKSIPGKVFKSKVSFIDPVLNSNTRTTIIRTELDNKSGKLRPGMFAEASIKSMLTNNKEAILVPKSAVLWTGKKSVVYIKKNHGETYAFHYREITLGEDTGTHYVVAEGLSEGESVVTNGAFKIDAAAQLKGSPSMMNPGGEEQSLGGHLGMDMSGDGDKKEEKETKKVAPMKQFSMDVDTKFKTQFSAVVTSYLALKDAFVDTNVKDAVAKSKVVKAQMKKIDMSLLKGDAHLMWMDMMKPINSNLDKIMAASDVEAQRLAFADLTEGIYNTLKIFNVTGLNVYYQFCPMAKDNKGAYWISGTEEIRNPYFGEAMLNCGSTSEVLN